MTRTSCSLPNPMPALVSTSSTMSTHRSSLPASSRTLCSNPGPAGFCAVGSQTGSAPLSHGIISSIWRKYSPCFKYVQYILDSTGSSYSLGWRGSRSDFPGSAMQPSLAAQHVGAWAADLAHCLTVSCGAPCFPGVPNRDAPINYYFLRRRGWDQTTLYSQPFTT